MVIGNGFFSDTKDAALREMTQRSGCEVRHLPFPTIGNIDYYISRHGDLYGMQRIQGKCLTRQRKHIKYSPGYKARLCEAPHKERHIYVQVLIYCTFVLGRWDPDIELEAVNGNVYDVRPENFRPKQVQIPPEWSERMALRQDVYASNFLHVMWSVNYTTQLDLQDCKDATQTAFLYLCTDGYNKTQYEGQDFVGLWVKVARLRAIDFLHVKVRHSAEPLEWIGQRDTPFEFDWFKLQPGQKRQTYLRMYFEGNKPTEIARHCGVSPGTVRSNVTRSVQFMKRYFKHDVEKWNKR